MEQLWHTVFTSRWQENNQDRIVALVRFYRKLYRTIACVVTVVGLCCIPFLDMIIKTDKEIPNLVVYYLFSLAGVVISYLFVYKTTLLDADQKNYVLTNIRLVFSVVKTIAQMLILLVFHNYILYLVISLLSQILNNLVASYYTDRTYPYLKNTNSPTDVESEVKKNLWSNVRSVFVYKFSVVMFSATDNILISTIIGTAVAGIYSNFLMISNKLLLIEQIIFSAVTASVGNVIVSENAKKKYQIFQAMQSTSFILCGIITTTYCVMVNDIVRIWLGENFMVTALTVIAISLNTYFSCALQPLWVYRDAAGLYQKTKWIMLCGAIWNIILSVVLGKLIGLAGIIFASAIARISTYFWYEPKLLFETYFERSTRKYYLSIFKNLVLVFVMVMVWGFAFRQYPCHSWGTVFIKTAIIGSINSVVFLLVYARTEGFQLIINKVKKVIHKK